MPVQLEMHAGGCTINIVGDVPPCIIMGLQNHLENIFFNLFVGATVSDDFKSEMECKLNVAIEDFMRDHTHRDGYPSLIKLLHRLGLRGDVR